MASDLTNPASIAQLLKINGLHTQKQFGQHFLTNRSVLEQVVTAAQLNQQDTVLEVGTGIGTLTVELARRAGQVIAFEVDRSLKPVLDQTVGHLANVDLYFQDVLTADLSHVLPDRYKIVANLPYNAGSHFLDIILKSQRTPQSITVLLQKEVAQKITAQSPHATYLSNFFQIYGQASIVQTVAPSNFFPPPKVDSAILHVAKSSQEMPIDAVAFSRFLHRGFAQPRKMLNKAFEPRQLLRANIEPTDRPEHIVFSQWLELFHQPSHGS
jgi:16S rRNA (adenine1518-N6/adenine1519-N6)-dimethyltransferase